MTPHIKAKKSEIGKIIIMPGDPLRAKLIAKKYLTNPKLVNDIRGMLAYTGNYKNKLITVMGHGMGCGSIGIYAYELFSKQFYDADLIIRIGSCASYNKNLIINDLFLVSEAYGDTSFDQLIGVEVNNRILKASPKPIELAINVANKNKINFTQGRALTSDAFYKADSVDKLIKRTKLKVAEMEAFGLYACAKKHQKEALTLLTIVHSKLLF